MSRQNNVMPESVRDEVMLKLYQKAYDVDWELLSNPEKTRLYMVWSADGEISSMLRGFMADRQVRVWIKDTAMKEYARAQEGIGATVRYVPRRYSGPQEIVTAAFGPDWVFDQSSIKIKPMLCEASREYERKIVIWGPQPTLGVLFWEAVQRSVDTDAEPVIVIVTRDGQDVQRNERDRHDMLGKRCGLKIVHLHRYMIDNPDYIG